MKIKKKKLKELVRHRVEEAAKEGRMQKIYRNSFSSMIAKASTGGNENTPPFTQKTKKAGKSGPPLMEGLKGMERNKAVQLNKGLHKMANEIVKGSKIGNILKKLLFIETDIGASLTRNPSLVNKNPEKVELSSLEDMHTENTINEEEDFDLTDVLALLGIGGWVAGMILSPVWGQVVLAVLGTLVRYGIRGKVTGDWSIAGA